MIDDCYLKKKNEKQKSRKGIIIKRLSFFLFIFICFKSLFDEKFSINELNESSPGVAGETRSIDFY